jgi:hypothetical protein
MAWYTLSEAAAKGLNRNAWVRLIQSGKVSSYVDGRGQRRVWIDDKNPVKLVVSGFRSDLQLLRKQVHQLRDELVCALPDKTNSNRFRRRRTLGRTERIEGTLRSIDGILKDIDERPQDATPNPVAAQDPRRRAPPPPLPVKPIRAPVEEPAVMAEAVESGPHQRPRFRVLTGKAA